jgi:hypothetical protein
MLDKVNNYNLHISTKKSEDMAFCGKPPLRSKIEMYDQPIEQAQSFTILGYKLTH